MIREKYKVAKYMRLSREDGDDRESESIENQRDIIDTFISEHEDLEVAKEYVDDGYTGTNFNRPGFEKMLEDIEKERIDCIITKDLSRFGRDHIDTGYYLERYFPTKSIRYIAIGDNVDTLKMDGLQFLTFKLSFNDYYAQDISNKIKSVKQRKIEKGEFQGGIAPYGYKKDKIIKNHLIIDEYASEIVKDIFDMYVNKGMSPNKIADQLNKREIIAPSIYLEIPTFMKRKSKNKDGKYIWLRTQIGKILKNEVYIGNVVGRKTQKISHKIDKVKTNKPEDYIIVENMHEPIIDLETWNKAQEKIKNKHVSRIRKYDHPLKGLIFCRECGGVATLRCRSEKRKSGKEWKIEYFICSNKNSNKNDCNCRQLRTIYIEEKVKEKIKEELIKINISEEELKKIYKQSKSKDESKKEKLNKRIERNNRYLNSIELMLEEIYKDKVSKTIQIEDFEMIYKKKIKERKKILEENKEINLEIDRMNKKAQEVNNNKLIYCMKNTLELKNINKQIYERFIEKIEFDNNRNLYIKFKFSKPV